MRVHGHPAARSSEHRMSANSCCPVCGESSPVRWLQGPDRFNGRWKPYQLVRCGCCGLVSLADPPGADETGTHYGESYQKLIAAANDADPYARWRSRCERIARYKTGGAILDAGCNSGGFLAAMNSGSWELYGIEFDSEQAKRASARTPATVFAGDLLAAQFLPHSFDVVTAFHFLEHLAQPGQALAKIRTWLKPGGLLYLTVPNIASWESRVFGTYWYGLELPRHLFHYTPKSLRRLVLQAGFQELWMVTEAGSYVEQSLRYMLDAAMWKLGFARAPLARANDPSLGHRMLRKVFRISTGQAIATISSVVGCGVHIEAMFQKG